MLDILEKLRGGELRPIGRADEVAEDMIENPILFEVVFEGLFDGDPIIRMRSADALEKASSSRPEHIQPFKRQLIEEAPNIKQKEVRWPLAQIYSNSTRRRDGGWPRCSYLSWRRLTAASFRSTPYRPLRSWS